MAVAGQRIRAADFPAAATDSQTTTGTTTSTASFTATITGGTGCSVVFTAPQSGRAMVANNARCFADSASNTASCGWEIRTGSVVGSGTSILSANIARSVRDSATSATGGRFGTVEMVTGLTAGDVYNIRQMFITSAGTGSFQHMSLSVWPVP